MSLDYKNLGQSGVAAEVLENYSVAVAYNTSIAAYSTDGITWTQSTLPASALWRSVTHGDGKFVAVAYNSATSAYSTDGITWTQTTMPTSAGWNSVTPGDGKFVAVAGGYGSTSIAAYSTDGITWTQSTLPSSESWFSVTYGDGKFVTVAYNSDTSAYSTDGITWTQTTMPQSAGWHSVTHGENIVLNESNQYTVPSTKQAITSSIYIANNSSTSQTYSVAVVPNGETLSSIHYIRKDVTIDGNDFHNIPTKITLSAGDQIITEGSSTEVSINIFGVEK